MKKTIENIKELIYLLSINNLSSDNYVVEYGNCRGDWSIYEYNLEDISDEEFNNLLKEWLDFKKLEE